MVYLILMAAVVLEVIGTTALSQSQQFTRPLPSLITTISYGGAFYLLSWVMKTMSVGVVYAIWTGLGTVLVAAIGVVYLNQKLDLAAVIGLGLIIAGLLVLNLLSSSVSH